MSVEALSWLANDAPGVKPHWFGTLFALCNSANAEGKGALPTQALMAWQSRKDERAVRDDLRALEGAGLIRKGDQRMVSHLPPDKRPVVWDLALEKTRGPRPGPGRPGRPKKRGGPEIPPEVETPPFPETGGSTDPGGTVDPPVFDLGKHASDGKRGGLQFRQNLRSREVELLLPLPPPGEEEEEEQPAPSGASTRAELTADELALCAELTAAAPRWSPGALRAVLAAAEIRERADRAVVRLAFLLAAEDLKTRTPRRLLHDLCPFWAAAERELYPRAAEPDPGLPVLVGRVAHCGSPSCDPVTRTAVHPETGNPVRGRPRCPVCHPQSPAGQP